MVMVRGKRRKIIIIVSVVGIVLASGALGYWLFFGRSTSPLPKELVAQAAFPVYYPKELPEGYALKPGSAIGDSTTVYYTLTQANGQNSITVSIQASPPGFDAAKIIGSNPVPTTITPSGTLYNLSIGGITKYMLVADDALLFMTAARPVSTKAISTITQKLTILHP